MDIVYSCGGIYLDTNVELLRNLDDLIGQKCFMGMEQVGTINTGLGYGSKAGHLFLRENKKEYENTDFVDSNGNVRPEICVKIATRLLREQGLRKENCIQQIDKVTVYPPSYFYSLKMGADRLAITENIYAIHHYTASWYTG